MIYYFLSFRYWNQLNEDMRILLQRFDAETGDKEEKNEESEATTSFFIQNSHILIHLIPIHHLKALISGSKGTGDLGHGCTFRVCYAHLKSAILPSIYLVGDVYFFF